MALKLIPSLKFKVQKEKTATFYQITMYISYILKNIFNNNYSNYVHKVAGLQIICLLEAHNKILLQYNLMSLTTCEKLLFRANVVQLNLSKI